MKPHYAHLKSVLGEFYAVKAISEVNEIGDQRKLTDEDIDKWLIEKYKSLLAVIATNVLLVSSNWKTTG